MLRTISFAAALAALSAVAVPAPPRALLATQPQSSPPPVITEEANVQPIDSLPFDRFGASASMGAYIDPFDSLIETVAFVGAPNGDGAQSRTGSVNVFTENYWKPWPMIYRVRADDGVPGDAFGAAVSSSETTARIAVGAPGRAQSSGGAYVYRFLKPNNGPTPRWIFEALLEPSDLRAGDAFGSAIAIADGPPGKEQPFLAIGAPHAAGAFPESGAVYIFRKPKDAAWELHQKLVGPPDALHFGSSVALALSKNLPEVLAIGAAGDESTPGTAIIFARDDAGTQSILDDVWFENARLAPIGGAAGDEFGASIAVRDSVTREADAVAVGSPGRDAAHVFRLDARGTPGDPLDDLWIQQAELAPQSASLGARFGAAVAIDGPVLQVGAPESGPRGVAGEVHRFDRDGRGTPDPLDDTWLPTRVFTAPEASAGDGFGAAVAVHGRYSAMGAPGDGELPADPGAAFVAADGDIGEPSQRLIVEAIAGATKGEPKCVDIDGDTLAVGTPGYSDVGLFHGAVHVYRRTAGRWLIEARLTAPDATSEPAFNGGNAPKFAVSLALDGDRLLVGAEEATGIGPDTGAAYVFRRSNGIWYFEGKLFDPLGTKDARFGHAVALAGDVAVVGVPSAKQPTGLDNAGATQVFRYRDGAWHLDQVLISSHPVKFEAFGYSLAVHGHRLAVGAPKTHGLVDGGTVHVFSDSGSGGWELDAVLANPAVAELFGSFVDLSEDHLAVSAWEDFGPDRVRVYSLASGAWMEEAKLEGGGPFAFDALDDDRLLVGRPEQGLLPGHLGVLSLYERTASGWTEEFRLAARETVGTNATLGATSLAFSGELAVSLAKGVTWSGHLTQDSLDVFSFDLAGAGAQPALAR